MMRLRSLTPLVFTCLLTLLGLAPVTLAIADEQKEEVILPEIVVQGEDRSFLQITREKQVFYMEPSAHKQAARLSLAMTRPVVPSYQAYTIYIAPVWPEVLQPKTERARTELLQPPPPISWSFQHDLLGTYQFALFPVRGALEQAHVPVAAYQAKEFIHPPLQISLETKPMYVPSTSPTRPGAPLQLVAMPPRESLPPVGVRQFGLSKPYTDEVRPSARPGYIERMEAGLPQKLWGSAGMYPPSPGPVTEDTAVQYQTGIEKTPRSREPFLDAYLAVNDKSGLNYGVDFGKEDEQSRYLLQLERDSQPHYAIFQETGQILARSVDRLPGTISWDQPNGKDTSLSAFAEQVNLDLPDAYTRIDQAFGFQGETSLSEQWDLEAWLEKSTRKDVNGTEESYDDLRYGIVVQATPEGLPMVIRAGFEQNNLLRTAPTETSTANTQTLLEVGWPDPIIIGENLVLDQPRLGVQGSRGQARIIASGMTHWYLSDQWQTTLAFDRSYYVPPFAETYIAQDYSQVVPELPPIDMTTFKLGATYTQPEQIRLVSELSIGFGDDIVWVYEELPEARLRPETLPLRRLGFDLFAEWQATPDVIIRPSISWQSLENMRNPDEKVPHEPDTTAGIELVMVLAKSDTYTLSFEGRTTWLGTYYYTLEPADIITGSANIELKLLYSQKRWEVFVELKNQDSSITYNYKLPSTVLTVGAKALLF